MQWGNFALKAFSSELWGLGQPGFSGSIVTHQNGYVGKLIYIYQVNGVSKSPVSDLFEICDFVMK